MYICAVGQYVQPFAAFRVRFAPDRAKARGRATGFRYDLV
jgi:hypothetical protein